MRHRFAVAVAVSVVVGGIGLVSEAEAARCGGQPDGVVNPADSNTWDSPGEVISFVNRQGIHPARPGQMVKLFCQGAP